MGPSSRIVEKTPEVIKLYQSGMNAADVSRQTSINIKTIRKILTRNQIPIRKGKYNLLSERYGRLVVVSFDSIVGEKQLWNCRCDCGNFAKVRTSDLTSHKQASCGCLRNESSRENIKKAQLVKRPNTKGFKELRGKYLSSVKLNAFKRDLEYSITPEFLWNLFESQGGKCNLSGEPISFSNPKTASVDRIDSSQGYTVSNVQWLHKDVNCMKMALTQKRFVELSEKIHKNTKLGVLAGTRAYLAGNLEYSSDSYNWRDLAKNRLAQMGVVPLDPTDVVFSNQPLETEEKRKELKTWRDNEQYDAVRDYMVPVVQKDLRQIDLSDFVIFNFQVDKPTFGTTHELVVATQQKKPIFVCVGDKKKTPLWFLGIVKPHYIYNSVEEALGVLEDINSGRKEIDSDRWRILKKELI